MTHVIGLFGRKRSGKGTLASWLRTRGYVSEAFAQFKRIVADLFPELSNEHLYGEKKEESFYLPPLDEFRARVHAYDFVAFFRGIVSDADPAQRMLDVLSKEFTRETSTPRRIMQLVGTEWGRAIDEDIWVKFALHQIEEQKKAGAPGVVLDDGRHENELRELKKIGALTIWIDADPRLPPYVPEHTSEPGPEFELLCDLALRNWTTIVEFRRHAHEELKRRGMIPYPFPP